MLLWRQVIQNHWLTRHLWRVTHSIHIFSLMPIQCDDSSRDYSKYVDSSPYTQIPWSVSEQYLMGSSRLRSHSSLRVLWRTHFRLRIHGGQLVSSKLSFPDPNKWESFTFLKSFFYDIVFLFNVIRACKHFQNDMLGCNSVSWAPSNTIGSTLEDGSIVKRLATGQSDTLKTSIETFSRIDQH